MTGSFSVPRAPKTANADRASRRSDRSVILVGFDFGSTTSSAVAARSRIGTHRFSGEVALERPKIVYRSTPVFTPIIGKALDIPALRRIIGEWMNEGGLERSDIFSGGAIITGLAATRCNAGALADLVREYAGESLIATADDPSLESWLAFMGNSFSLSKHHVGSPVLNLDIGGGTTNTALGLNGEILCTGCAFIGARHFRFSPGTYRLTGMSSFGKKLLNLLEMPKAAGDIFDAYTVDRLVDWMVLYLEELVTGPRTIAKDPRFGFLEQVPLRIPEAAIEPILTFSGGVGEMVYAAALGNQLPETTSFGDLGIDLARRIASSPILSKGLLRCIPENRGHATVYGLALHHTEISGTTLFLPHPERLPLKDLPVVARLKIDDGLNRIAEGLMMARKCASGGAIQVAGDPPHQNGGHSAERFRRFGRHLETVMTTAQWPDDRPLVLLLTDNCGKAVGNYATRWGRHALPLLVLDEIPEREAHFVTIGRKRGALVPVSFFGMYREPSRIQGFQDD